MRPSFAESARLLPKERSGLRMSLPICWIGPVGAGSVSVTRFDAGLVPRLLTATIRNP